MTGSEPLCYSGLEHQSPVEGSDLDSHFAYIGLGSNSGDRWANLRRAVSCLKSARGLGLRRVSSVYQSEADELENQPDFLNGACKVETRLPPLELLPILQAIENDMGRTRRIPKGPRVIDLDILLYDDLVVDEENLKIPHPGLHTRKFVLLPLLEISPDLRHPLFGKRLDELLRELVDESWVELAGVL